MAPGRKERKGVLPTEDGVDVKLEGLPSHIIGDEVAHRLLIKGVCVVDPGLEAGVVAKALDDVRDLESKQQFRKVHVLISAGLLGMEGSASCADLESADLPDEERKDGEALVKLDNLMTSVGIDISTNMREAGVQFHVRANTVVNRAGEPMSEDTSLADKAAQHWLGIFIRHRVMVLLCVGPSDGVLELRPWNIKEAEPLIVKTYPGRMILLRPDVLSHEHYASGRSYVLTCFFLSGPLAKRTTDTSNFTPYAYRLETHIMRRLTLLKKSQSDRDIRTENPGVPAEWIGVMNHIFIKGQLIAVRGMAAKMSSCETPEDFRRSSAGGADFGIEVPTMRWDHSTLWDPDPESFRNYKSYCRHATFMDGTELFDCRMFSMTPNEAKSMDPHQRLILEVGYCALHSMGMRKNTLVNTQCGVYVGCGNTEWSVTDKQQDFGAFGATGGALSISSGRFSYSLGLKGPSMTLDTEGSSGATAVYLGAEGLQYKGRAPPSEIACAIGAHILLTPMWWPSQCASGWLGRTGRCLAFDASADGYIRGDGVAAAGMKAHAQVVDGKVLKDADAPLVGSLAGAMMNNNGCGASLSAPHGPSEQEAMAEAIRNADVEPFDIDAVEAHAVGSMLADAIEGGSIMRAHRNEMTQNPLLLMSSKSSVGNQVEVGGIASFLRALYSIKFGCAAPLQHLRQANPHMEVFAENYGFVTEVVEHRLRSTFTGVFSKGFGGSNVYLVAVGEMSSHIPIKMVGDQEEHIHYWPGGGGELDQDSAPTRCYTIVGTWSRWTEAHNMFEEEGSTSYGFTVVLGENRWEQFQIWLDGDSSRALHPGYSKAPKDSTAFGPDEDAHGLNWLIDGRDQVVYAYDGDGSGTLQTFSEQRHSQDRGMPGDMYNVQLLVRGKWRAVTWRKVEAKPEDMSLSAARIPPGTYYVVGAWTGWEPEEMTRDTSTPDVFYLDMQLFGSGEFQIVRDRDWNQVFYPLPPAEGEERVGGPDDHGHDINWRIQGPPGEWFRIEFERRFEADGERRSVRWKRLEPKALGS